MYLSGLYAEGEWLAMCVFSRAEQMQGGLINHLLLNHSTIATIHCLLSIEYCAKQFITELKAHFIAKYH